jgi:hypothetical protein
LFRETPNCDKTIKKSKRMITTKFRVTHTRGKGKNRNEIVETERGT